MTSPLSYEIPAQLKGPAALSSQLAVGDLVNVPLSGRNVYGWIVGFDDEAPHGVTLRPINRVASVGPSPDIISLCYWTAEQWVGRPSPLLSSASPPKRIQQRIAPFAATRSAQQQSMVPLAADFWEQQSNVFVAEVAPTEDLVAVVSSVLSVARTLVIIPNVEFANRMARQLRSRGHTVARWPDEWALARAGASVVGTRPAVFASMDQLEAIIVIDEHDPLLQQESSPTWHARDVAVERGRRHDIPVMLLSPIPSLEARFIAAGVHRGDHEAQTQRLEMETVPTIRRRRGATARHYWPEIQVIDRRGEDSSRTGLYSPRLVQLMRDKIAANERVLCILNRTGRSQLLICRSCQSMVTCAECQGVVRLEDDTLLHCTQCGESRPSICTECGATRLVQLRIGVSKAREELEVLLGVSVASVTAQHHHKQQRTPHDSTRKSGRPKSSVSGHSLGTDANSTMRDDPDRCLAVVGTSATLNQPGRFAMVAFLDFDQQLMSPGYRTGERAATQLIGAARLLRSHQHESSRPMVALQTRMPEHPVIEFIERGDPTPLAQGELERRQLLELPPIRNAAVIGGESSPAFVAQLKHVEGLTIRQRNDQAWMIQAASRDELIAALNRVERGPGRLRLQVDPYEFPRWTQEGR